MALTAIRIFVSSPGDVAFERRVALAAVERLRGEFGAHLDIRPILWEQQPLRATEHFQEQIASTAEVDIAVFVLWTRLGTLLPDQFLRDDGTPYASGTEFEFECAARAHRETGRPAMLAYLKKAERSISLADRESAMDAFAQKDALDYFVDRWFGNPQSAFRAAFKTFETADEFERVLERDLRSLIIERRPAVDSAAPRAVTWSRGSPFRGLSAFEFEHAPVFFGRTRALADVRNALLAQAQRGCRFLLVLGMSGAGKSSLVHAGVLPAITQPGVVEGVDLWRWCSMRPSGHQRDLLLGLARAMLSSLASADAESGLPAESALAVLLHQSPAHAAAELGAALQRVAVPATSAQGLARPPVARLIVVIDQFEEVFALAEITSEARAHFVKALDALARGGHAFVIATMRSDFYSRCAELPVLVRLKEGPGQYEVLPPSRSEIEQMVRAGASAAGLRFEAEGDAAERSEESLDRTLIDAASSNPAALPLLEFALEELYRRRTPDDLMTFAAYREFGGLEGAIGRRAEEVHTQISPACQARLPDVFAHLLTVRLDEGRTASAVRVPRSSLPPGAEVDAIVDAFVAARLLVSDRTSAGEAAISITHESLLSNWPRLARWVTENETFLERRAYLLLEAQQWHSHGREEARLIPAGDRLDEAEDFLAAHADTLPREIGDYVGASTRLRRSAGKYLWLGTGVVLALLVVVTVVSALVLTGPSAVKLDQVALVAGLATWMLFIAHLRWRADPKRVARRKTFGFTLLITAALMFSIAWRVAGGITAEIWRNELVIVIGTLMFVAFGAHVALDLLSAASSEVRARRRKRFWGLFSVGTAALLATVPTGVLFAGGPADGVAALSLILTVAVAVLALTYAPVRSRSMAPAAGATPSAVDPFADAALAAFIILPLMALMPQMVDFVRSEAALCGDIEGFSDAANLRCAGPPHPGSTVIRLERKSRRQPVTLMKIVDADGNCRGKRLLPPRMEFLRDLELIESGLTSHDYCLSEFDYDEAGMFIGETLKDGNGKRLTYVNKLEGVLYLYGSKPGIYLGRMRPAPDARDGEVAWLAEFNSHHLWNTDADGKVQAIPSRRWVFNRNGWPIRISHLAADGKPVVVARFGYASVEMTYADKGSLIEARFLGADDQSIALESGVTRLVWEYDGDGACTRRISLARDGTKFGEEACR